MRWMKWRAMSARPYFEEATKTLLAASADAFACAVEGRTLGEVAAKKSAECATMLKAAVSAKGSAGRLLEAVEAGRTAAVQAMLTGGARTATTFLSWHIVRGISEIT